MARDRKRAKQRRQRGTGAAVRRGAAERTENGASPSADAGPPSPGSIDRADLPGALEHASSDVDEFDAALIAGAGGVPAGADDIEDDPKHLSESEIEAEAEGEGDLSEDELQELSSDVAARSVTPAQASGAPLRSGNRAIGFLRASWAELQRVQWPDRRHVFQATAVVLGFVAIAGAYLGIADYVAKEFVELIL